MRTVLLFLTFLASLLTSFALNNRVNDISYAQMDNAYANERCKLDVYYATDKKDVPVVEWYHGAMPYPGYNVMNEHTNRLYKQIDDVKKALVGKIDFKRKSSFKNGAKAVREGKTKVLDLGSENGYYDLTAEMGKTIMSLNDYTFSMYYKVSSKNKLDGYGHFAFACSALAENSAEEGPYVAFRLNEQRFEVSTGGYKHEEFIMSGEPAKKDEWVHVVYRQKGRNGELFIDGKLIGKNNNMPFLSEIFKEAPVNCWIGRAPFKGDKYLTDTKIKDMRIYNYAMSDKDIATLAK